ncbi:peptide deformylase [Methylophilus sp. TWE2]|uniref:peptide deformylase n=1 Tax=Methylophilus sp. TWE2 TaxID=1662285 RepID=UPI0006708EAD|nr:peptide deformylase [Methylophilus sp. TWE2]AKR43041.1 peptide deformylase [Methylophilus sp. TWE2]
MAVKPVLRMGEPLLYRVADRVTAFDTPELHALIQDMHDTMTDMNGAGIAAPQIGVSLQVVMFGVGKNPRYPDAEEVPFTILINPELTPIDQREEEGWEGCLSVPGMRGLVPRYQHLHYRGFDPQGNIIDRTVSGFHARVVQHECDHLFGVLYPMRIRDMTKFGFNEVLFPRMTLPDD